MIWGIGTDILRADRIAKGIDAVGSIYLDRVYTKKEQEESCSHLNRSLFYASRFSAKEAVYKALHYVDSHMNWLNIEILTDQFGIPYVVLHGSIKKYAQQHNIQHIILSISYEIDYVTATAIAEQL